MLAEVFYRPPEGCPNGASAFYLLKRDQYRAVAGTKMVQAFIRQAQFSKRVKARVHAKREKAARVVQRFYRNRLQLGKGGNSFAEAVKAKLMEKRQAEAELRAQRRAEAMRRAEAEMGEKQLRAQQQARSKALAKSLRERAAVDTMQRSVRRCIGKMAFRKLRLKRALFLRTFVSDQTGHALRMLITLQRRVRLWLANNAMFHNHYEDHRRRLGEIAMRPAFEALEADVMARLSVIEEQREAAQQALGAMPHAALAECDVLLKLGDAKGELRSLQYQQRLFDANEQPPVISEGQRRSQLAFASAQREKLAYLIAADVHERCALHVQARRAIRAAATFNALTDTHACLLPFLVGQSYVLHEHARHSVQAVASRELSITELVLEVESAAAEIQLYSSQRPLDDGSRVRRMQLLERQVLTLESAKVQLQKATAVWQERACVLGEALGAQHALSTVLQACHWRSWQHARAQRIRGLTLLQVSVEDCECDCSL